MPESNVVSLEEYRRRKAGGATGAAAEAGAEDNLETVECPICFGSTKETCPECEGNALAPVRKIVLVSGGRHRLIDRNRGVLKQVTKDTVCGRCMGERQVTCRRCFGQGKVREFKHAA